MIDTSHIDLIALIGADVPLKKVASKEYAGPCPFCGGKDRFRVFPFAEHPRFWCRQCNYKGDAISYVQQKHQLDFRDALHFLRLASEDPQRRLPIKVARSKVWSHPPDTAIALTDAAWQRKARDFVQQCADQLQKSSSRPGWTYLRSRGLTEEVCIAHQIGFNPKGHEQLWGKTKVWLPRGIVIPWEIGGTLWRIQVRKLPDEMRAGEDKYGGPTGGTNALYRADAVAVDSVVVMVEGEIDALSILVGAHTLIRQNAIAPVATGSTTGARRMEWILTLTLAQRVLVAFDDDEPGENAAIWWTKKLGKKAARLKPTQHDVNDMLRMGEDLNAWIRNVL